jgi:hypothetical protein
MENIQQNGRTENPTPAVSKIDRLQQRAQRLQHEAQQARERVREQEALQEKLERLKARRKADIEVKRLGTAAWIAGLREVRTQLPGLLGDQEQPLDIDLLIGAMTLLREQLFEIVNAAEVVNLRARGESMRRHYFADKNCQKFSVRFAMTPTCEEKVSNGEGL